MLDNIRGLKKKYLMVFLERKGDITIWIID